MIISKKIFIVVAATILALGSLFYLFTERDEGKIVATNDSDVNTVSNTSQSFVSWQKITIAEEEENIFIKMTVPRIIIYSSDGLGSKINKAVTEYIDLLKDDFIFSVSTAAYDNGEANTLNIDTEILLITPRLISLAFTSTHHLAGVKDDDPERTFLVFDLTDGKLMTENNELFRNNSAWSEAVKTIKTALLSNYQGDPNCDLLFAPKYNGFSASCIGVDWSRGGKHLSINGDIPISMIQEFLAPAVLSDIIQ